MKSLVHAEINERILFALDYMASCGLQQLSQQPTTTDLSNFLLNSLLHYCTNTGVTIMV